MTGVTIEMATTPLQKDTVLQTEKMKLQVSFDQITEEKEVN